MLKRRFEELNIKVEEDELIELTGMYTTFDKMLEKERTKLGSLDPSFIFNQEHDNSSTGA